MRLGYTHLTLSQQRINFFDTTDVYGYGRIKYLVKLIT